MPENNDIPTSRADETQIDPHNAEQVRAFFARLEREQPQLIEAMKVMNISYQQYLVALRAMNQRASVSTSSAQITLP